MEELITETVHDADLLHPSSDPTEAHNRKVSFHTPSDSVCPPTDTTTKVYNVIQEHSAHNTERHNQLRPIANGHWEKKTHEVALQTDLTSTQERTNSKTEPSWVDSYTLPDFSPTLRQRITSLKKRDILEACYRSEIINCLFHSVFELQSHPKQLECTTICDMLIIKYPALQDKDPCFWQKLLSQKFKDYHHVTDFVKANFGGFPKRSRQGDGDNNEFPKSKVTRCEQVGKKKSSKNVPSVQSRADVPMPTHSRSTKSSLSTSSDDDSMTSSFEVTNVSESDKSPPLNESCSTVNSLVPWATNVGVRRGMPLPKFSEKVESALKVGSAGFVMNRVIQECALHVLKHGDMVKKGDYGRFSKAICNRYKCLQSNMPPYPWSCFSHRLSQKIRNERMKLKRGKLFWNGDPCSIADVSSKKVGEVERPQSSSSCSSHDLLSDEEERPPVSTCSNLSNTDVSRMSVDEATERLNQEFESGGDQNWPNVVLLFKRLHRARRVRLQALKSREVSEILTEFPTLENIKLIREEFTMMMPQTIERMRKNYDKMLKVLDTRDAEDVEIDELDIISKLQIKLTNKRFKEKFHFDLITVCMEERRSKIRSCKKSEPPHLIISQREAGGTRGWIQADKKSIPCHDDDGVFGMVIDLMSCYYVWNQRYPKTFETLVFLQEVVLGDSKSKYQLSCHLDDFLKQFRYQSQSNGQLSL